MPVGQCLGDDPASWYRHPVWSTPGSISKHGCLVSDPHFCGKLARFDNREQCFESTQKCEKDVEECKKNDQVDKASCGRMEKICNMQFLYCVQCGKSDEQKDCDIEHFNVNKEV